jgi:hypothetical protein
MAAITELINKSTTWDGPDFVVPAISANVVGRDGKYSRPWFKQHESFDVQR